MTPSESIVLSVDNVREWLGENHPKQLVVLDKFEMQLRLGRLNGSSTSRAQQQGVFGASDRRLVTSRTVELLRILIGGTRWKHAAELLTLLRGLGKELHAVGGFREPAIGNVVRRVMAAVREEVVTTSTDQTEQAAQSRPSLQSILWTTHPQLVVSKTSSSSSRHDSFADSNNPVEHDVELPPQFYAARPDLKQTIMEVIQEIMSDLEDLHKNINEQALSHIHADEVILTYGRSRTIELVSVDACVPVQKNLFSACVFIALKQQG